MSKRLFVVGLLFAALLPAQTTWSVGFYTPWGTNPIADLNFAALTHINHVGGTPQGDGSIILSPNFATIAPALISAAHAAGVKVSFTIGPETDGTYDMAGAITNHLATLVTNVMSTVNTYGYDGVDIDMEGDYDFTLLSSLIGAMRTALGGSKLLSIDVLENSYGSSWAAPSANVDRVNAMTYSMGGTWNPYSWFNSPLGGPTPVEVDYIGLVVSRYVAAGVPAAKLNIGIPFYGTKSVGGTPVITGPRQAFTSAPTLTEINYNSLVAGYDISTPTRDSVARQPWISTTSPSGWINYDDAVSITEKVQYVKTNNLGGWIIWQLACDYIAAGTPKHPLMAAIQAAGMTTPGGGVSGATISGAVLK
jgi:chitinase